MSDRSRELMTRPLFVEAGAEPERADEWSYPKGIMFGGMVELAHGDERSFADQYFSAAEAIVDLVLRNEVADYTVQNPICYLYRHAFELYLKAIIRRDRGSFPQTHSLEALANRATLLEPWAERRLGELHLLDPKSLLLRYGGPQSAFDGENWAELKFFRDAMSWLREYFLYLLDADSRRVDLRLIEDPDPAENAREAIG